MKVFLSWSGILSHKIASALREWLPSVIQAIEPYLSSEDIDKGARWSVDIAAELNESNYGVLCITPENLEAPWIMFEAGALSKSLDKSRVVPFLYNLKRSEIQGPLLQFQSVITEHDDIWRLLSSMNASLGDKALSEEQLKKTFEVWWPILEKMLSDIGASIKIGTPPKKERTADSNVPTASTTIIEEILELSRTQQKLLRSPDIIVPKEYLYPLLEEAISTAIMRMERATPNHPAWRHLIDTVGRAMTLVGEIRAAPKDSLDRGEQTDQLFKILIEAQEICEYLQRRVLNRSRPPELGLRRDRQTPSV